MRVERRALVWWATMALLCSVASADVGQRVRFQSFSTDRGLSQTSATSLLIDRHGYLWIGTQDGLNRYDGQRFAVFRHEVGNPTSLAENTIYSLAEDRQGNLWVGGLTSLSRIGADGAITRFDQTAGLASGSVFDLLALPDGDVLVSTRARVQRYSPGGKVFRDLPGLPPAERRQRALALDGDAVWIAHENQLLRWDNGDAVRFGERDLPLDVAVIAVLRRASGALAVASLQHGLFEFDAQGALTRHWLDELPDPSLRVLHEDKLGRLWIGTAAGLARIEGQLVEIWRHAPGMKYALPSNRVVDFAEDASGALYIGTWNGGFARTHPVTESFLFFSQSADPQLGLPTAPVTAVAAPANGELWIGQIDGGGLTNVPADRSIARPIRLSDVPSPRRGNVTALLPERDTLWIGYGDGGVEAFRGAALGAFDGGGLANAGVQHLRRATDGSLIVGTTRAGLYRRCADCSSFDPVPIGPDGRSRAITVNYWLETADGWTYLATDQGIRFRQTEQSMWRELSVATDAPLRLPHDKITWLLETRNRQLYAGTQGGGLLRIERRDNGEPAAIRAYDERSGLASAMIGAVLEDSRGRLWVSTTRGLCLYSTETESARCLGTLDPVLAKDAYIGSAATGPNDALYFGGSEGLIGVLDAGAFEPPAIRAKLVLTELRIGNVPVRPGSGEIEQRIEDATEIRLRHDQDLLSIDFAALELSAAQTLRYSYQLIGHDMQPIQTDALRRTATYTDLPAGRYVLDVRAFDGQGLPIDSRRIDVRIDPSPLWSAPARIAYLLCLFGLGAGIVWRARVRRSERAAADQALAQSEALLNHSLWGSGSELWDADLSSEHGPMKRRNRLDHLKVTHEAGEDSLRAYAPFVHVDDRAGFGQALRAAVRGDADLFECQYRVQNRAGAWRWLYTRGRVFARNADGRALRLVGTTLDVTDLRARDEALRLSEERLKLAVWGSGDELWDIDFRSGVVRRENALAATMLADEATFPKLSDYLVFVHPDDRELLRQTLTSHVKGETALFECSYRAKARGEGWVWVSGKGRVVARDSNGWALRMVGTNRDITAIKRAEDALRELNEDLEVRVDRRTEALARSNRELQRALDELTRTQRQLVESEKLAALGGLVAGVAHEINTPLGVGVTAASHLQAEARSLEQRFALGQIGKAELKQFIDQATQSSDLILRNLDRASQLVRSFKQVAVDQSSEQRREFRLKSYLNEILVSLHPRIRKIDVKVRIECEDSITLDTYPGALYQIVVNLIINSLVHGFEGRQGNQIEIAARADGDKVVIDYRDNGKGMSEAVKRRVFEPFFTTKRGTGGSGLGMHIVYNLTTQLLGGVVSCESDEGKGVHVQLRVPMVAPRGRTDAA